MAKDCTTADIYQSLNWSDGASGHPSEGFLSEEIQYCSLAQTAQTRRGEKHGRVGDLQG